MRLPPSTFTDLPAKVQAELQQRGCTVPQTFGGGRPHNVISGRFTTSEQLDFAVLCSVNRSSSILVFRGGSAREVAEIAPIPDAGYLQVVNPGEIGFSRAISTVDAEYIREHHEQYGGPEPPSVLDHDGIDDAFAEKASVVWYWHDGRWLRLTGSD
ncbi:MAG: hypothetical protein GEV06_06040 [Luteitalea sp.]|nr:hypothetical protein [Luteitalea sp.]